MTCRIDKDKEVINGLHGLSLLDGCKLTEIDQVYGAYDIVVKVEVNSMEQLKPVIEEMRKIPDIRFMQTMITF